MSIEVTCGSCFSTFKAKDKYAGRRVLCKECGEPITVPERGSSPDPPATDDFPADDPTADAAAPPTTGRKRKKRRRKKSEPEKSSTFQIGVAGIVSVVCGALFLLMCLVGIFWRPALQLMFWGLMLTGAGLCLFGGVRCLLIAFDEDIQCGVLYVLVPFYALYYWATRIGEVWKPLLMHAGGAMLLFVALVMDAAAPDIVPTEDGRPGLITQMRVAATRDPDNAEQLRRLMLQMHNHHDTHRRFPPHPEEEGSEIHASWMTSLLPYVDQEELYDQMNRDVEWDADINHEANRTIVSGFLRPSIGEKTGQRGFALSHFALNQECLDDSGGMRIGQITDGVSRTVVIGEVGGGYKPWADPSNVRDVSAGLVPGPDTFGNPIGEGGFLGFGDGSVRWFSSDTDPEVLKAISTPNGGEFIEF